MFGGRLSRWLYGGQRPNLVARVINRFWAVVASTGATARLMVTLEVKGRRTGRTVSLPVVVTVVNRRRYLVSMLGDNVQWVRNVRAAGGRATLRSGKRQEVWLREVPPERRAPILKAYLQLAPGARPHIPVSKDAPLSEFEQIESRFPVFLIAARVVGSRSTAT